MKDEIEAQRQVIRDIVKQREEWGGAGWGAGMKSRRPKTRPAHPSVDKPYKPVPAKPKLLRRNLMAQRKGMVSRFGKKAVVRPKVAFGMKRARPSKVRRPSF
jgi:hypothetical protein